MSVARKNPPATKEAKTLLLHPEKHLIMPGRNTKEFSTGEKAGYQAEEG